MRDCLRITREDVLAALAFAAQALRIPSGS
ncbi:MAG: hypothetical protein AB7Y46_11750 [Armatimonadota bacterium]